MRCSGVRARAGAQAVCCLYATAPFVQPADLVEAGILLEQAPISFVFPATSFPFPIQRAIAWTPLAVRSCFNPSISTPSQDLDEAFHDAGQFYWARPEAWISSVNIFDDACPLILPRWRVQDIDTEEDWLCAEQLHHLMEQRIDMNE